MTETMLRTLLGEKILKHWREHSPQMVRDLERKGRLDEAVLEAQETTGDLLYELVSVRKMNYPAAWELATQEWALPQSANQNQLASDRCLAYAARVPSSASMGGGLSGSTIGLGSDGALCLMSPFFTCTTPSVALAVPYAFASGS